MIDVVLLQIGDNVSDVLFEFLGDFTALVLRLIGGLILALIVARVGISVAGRVEEFIRRIDLSDAVMETPLGAPLRDGSSVESLIESIVKYIFYLIAVFVVVSFAGFRALGQYIDLAVRYLPSVLGGILVVVVGFVIAGYVGRSIRSSPIIGGSDVAALAGETAKAVIYLISVTLGLDAFGYSTAILTTLAQAVVVGVGLGVAIAVGIAVGLGSQEYVSENIESWVGHDSSD
jgi:hypothetical protein